MAVRLLGADNARIDYGDPAFLAGLPLLTVAITVQMSAFADNQRFFSQWGNADAERAFILSITSSDELFFGVSDPNPAISRGSLTSGFNLVAGQLYRIVAASDDNVTDIRIWANGKNLAAANAGGPWTGNWGTLRNGTAALQIGHETDEAVDGPDGEYAEAAIWNRVLSEAEAGMYGRGYSPLAIPKGLIFYAPLRSANDLHDKMRRLRGVGTAVASAAHPSLILPPRSRTQFLTLNPTITYLDMDNEVEIDPADWGGTVTAYLEIHAKSSHGSHPFHVQLYNDTTASVVAGSHFTISATANTRGRSGPFSLAAGPNIYRVQYGGESGFTFTPDPDSHARLILDVA